MKVSVSCLAVLSLLQLSSARPHAHNDAHKYHARTVVTKTEVAIVTAEAAHVVVLANEKAVAYSTVYDDNYRATAVVPDQALQSEYVRMLDSAYADYMASEATDGEDPALEAEYVRVLDSVSQDYFATATPVADAALQSQYVRLLNSVSESYFEAAASATAAVAAPSKVTVEIAPTTAPPATESKPTPPPAPKAAPAPAPAPAPKAPAAAPPVREVARGHGVSYAPYNSDSSCKTGGQVTGDFAALSRYAVVRMYGTDCNQVATGLSAAKTHGQKLFVGIWDINRAVQEADLIIAAAKNDWYKIDTVAVGNEAVNTGRASVGAVIGAVNAVRAKLRAAGYQGPVVTVDTYNQIIAHPELCQASDFVAANCHPFFTPTVASHKAGDYVAEQARVMRQVCPGKRVVITETGWPHGGSTNGAAIPSKEHQQIALGSIRAAFDKNPGDLILFSAFDDPWKKDNGGTFGAERFWGIS